MLIEDIIKDYPLPERYMRNGKECFYDIYRAKLIPVTPEEVVRQKIAHWCVKKMQVPPQVIILEQHLSHYQIPSRDRADIIIHEETETGLLPLAVIECKATSVALSEKTFHQCFSYSELLQTEYAIITNGVELLAYKYNAETNEYDLLSEPPTYFQMLGREATIEEPHEIVPRPSYTSLFSERTQQRYVDDYIIGAATSVEYRAYAINLLEAFLDEEDTLQKRSSSFELIKDLGVRILSYGNAAGFDYVAPYRSFLIKDKTGNNQIISLGFNAYGNNKTILCVAIDDFRKSHHALQLLFDKYMTIHNGVMMFKHNGQISVGHRGSASASELIRVVKEECAQLVDEENKINLGTVDANNDIHLSSDDMTSFVYNLLEYALIRDEYRDAVNEKRT